MKEDALQALRTAVAAGDPLHDHNFLGHHKLLVEQKLLIKRLGWDKIIHLCIDMSNRVAFAIPSVQQPAAHLKSIHRGTIFALFQHKSQVKYRKRNHPLMNCKADYRLPHCVEMVAIDLRNSAKWSNEEEKSLQTLT